MKKELNYRLIFLLSLGGLALAALTLFSVKSSVEQVIWALMFTAYGYPVLKYGRENYFFHGLYAGLLNMLWMALVHTIWLPVYLSHHIGQGPFFVSLAKSPYPRLVVLLMELLKYSFTALVAGFFTYIMANSLKKIFEGRRT
jgi:hypothetical protein